jgi:hypothetical protein
MPLEARGSSHRDELETKNPRAILELAMDYYHLYRMVFHSSQGTRRARLMSAAI